MLQIDWLRELNFMSILLRVALSLAVGGLLGLERGRRNRPAGFRTYMLVCLGAVLVMMTNQYASQQFGLSDPVRMGAQVVSGIGFLGAGTIVMTGKSQIKGITTAAGLWAAACCGLAIGVGFYEGAVLGGGVVFLVMSAFQRVDNRIRQRSQTLEVYLELGRKASFGGILEYAREQQVDLSNVQIQKNKTMKDGGTTVIATAHCKRRTLHSQIIELLSDAPGVTYVEELQ